jgi:hypothetical protein
MGKRRKHRAASPRETEKTPAKSPVLVPQPHGGVLRQGGTNKGGPGRPPSAIRATLRQSFEERVKVLEAIADGEVAYKLRSDGEKMSAADLTKVIPSVADRLKAMDLLAKYGLGTTSTQTDTEGNDAMTLTDAIRAARAEVASADDE